MKEEQATFIKVLKAVLPDQLDFKPHEKARTARSLAVQLAMQPTMISGLVKTGVLDFTKSYDPGEMSLDDTVKLAEKNYKQVLKDVEAVSEEDWDEGEAKMMWKGGEWKTKKFEMAWGLLFDGIHHRGQLSTYIRIMGGKVPSIYGGSADAPPGA